MDIACTDTVDTQSLIECNDEAYVHSCTAGIGTAGAPRLIECTDTAGVHPCCAWTDISGAGREGAPPVTRCISIASVQSGMTGAVYAHSCIADMIGLGAVSAR